MIDYLNELREGCLSAYTGIIQGLRNSANSNTIALAELQLVTAQLPFIVQFLETIARDTNKSDSIVGAAIGLIGDLVTSYGQAMIPFVERDVFEKLLAEGKRSKVMKTKTLATWAIKEIRKLKNN
jgi:importin subunit beta-1